MKQRNTLRTTLALNDGAWTDMVREDEKLGLFRARRATMIGKKGFQLNEASTLHNI
jgi:hypothetical protein